MRTIDIDDELYDWLAEHAQPFESASDVIRREVGLDKASSNRQARRNGKTRNGGDGNGEAKRTHIPSDLILRIEEYYIPLLRAVADRGGSARRLEVIADVGRALDGKLTPHDLEETTPGRIRWRGRVGWARQGLVVAGYLADDPDSRGIWKLTEKGRKAAETGKLLTEGRLRTKRPPAQ
jgi:predicted CopG family antitoxin